jgi:hypothetical protein
MLRSCRERPAPRRRRIRSGLDQEGCKKDGPPHMIETGSLSEIVVNRRTLMVQPDGTLEVTEKVKLPAGRVQVTVQRLAEPVQPDRFWKMMESIWADLRADGRSPRTSEEIDAEIDALRNEAEEEMQAVEGLQEECRRATKQVEGAQEPPP